MVRAQIVLGAAGGADNTDIAAAVGVHVDTVRKWRSRFAAKGLAGLEDLPRTGRRRRFTAVQVAEVKALACTLPAETGAPMSRWSSAELATRESSTTAALKDSPLRSLAHGLRHLPELARMIRVRRVVGCLRLSAVLQVDAVGAG